MPKVAKKDFKKRLNDSGLQNDILIPLLEDLEDSWNDNPSEEMTELQTERDNLKTELDSLKEKYKQRFMDSSSNINMNTNIETKKEDTGLKEPRKFDDLFDEKGDLK